MKFLALALVSLALTAQAVEKPFTHGEWMVLRDGNFTFPYGTSVSQTFPFNPPVNTTRVAIQYTGTYCNVIDQYIEVRYTNMPAMVMVPKQADGTYLLTGPFTHMKVHNYQGQWTKIACHETIYALVEGSDPDPDPVVVKNFEYVGSLTVEGGSKSELSLASKLPERVTHLWVEVPAFCSELEVLEAGTVTEGYYDEAKLVDEAKNIFEIQDGVGVRIGAIQVTVKAPKGLTCPINLYLKKK